MLCLCLFSGIHFIHSLLPAVCSFSHPAQLLVRCWLNGIADLVAHRGVVLVSCRSRDSGDKKDEFPLPLDLDEISGFERAGMQRLSLGSYDDDQQPPVPHFCACYQRP